MNNVIFSMFFKPKFDTLKEKNNLISFMEYKQDLLKCKQEYAKKCDADWIFFDKIGYVQSFQKKFSINTIYDAINLYKIYMFEELGKKYDNVLYLDFDVIPKTDKNFFDEVDLSKKIWCLDQNDIINHKNFQLYKTTRTPTIKYMLAKCLLSGKENDIINTAILGASKEVIRRIDFMKKLPVYIKKTNDFVQGKGYARKIGRDYEYFTHNNEAFFSAAVVENNVEIQNDDRTWHTRLDNRIVCDPITHEKTDLKKHLSDAKFLHMINKNFDTYYKNKKNAIYSLHVEIPPELQQAAGNFTGDDIDKNERARINFLEYFDRLENNRREYARSIGAAYMLFENDSNYQEFRSWMKNLVDMSEYNVVNFYKIWCMEQLTKEYDNVLYMDFDVIVNTDVSFFDAFNCQNSLFCNYDTTLKDWANKEALDLTNWKGEDYVYHYRSPSAKYWNAHALLSDDDLDGENDVYNTGIFGASRRQMDELGYFEDFEGLISRMTELREDEFSMYIPPIQKSFGYDNETVMSYRVKSNNVFCENLDNKFWHFQLPNWKQNKQQVRDANAAFYHVMNKRFEWFDDII